MKNKDQPVDKAATPIPFAQELTQLLYSSREFEALPPAAKPQLRASAEIFNMEPGTRYFNTSQTALDFLFILGGALSFYTRNPDRKRTLRKNQSLAFDTASSLLGKTKIDEIAEVRAGYQVFRDTHSKLQLGAKLARIPFEVYSSIVHNYTSSLRERCKLFFLKKVNPVSCQEYHANDYLLRQQQYADKAYIIVEGEVKLVKRRTIDSDLNLTLGGVKRSPLSLKTSLEPEEGGCGKKSPEKHKATTRPNQEDIMLAWMGRKSWIGQEGILRQTKMPYSAVVVNRAVVFEISEDLLNKLPKQTKTQLLKMSLEKKQFLQERFQTLCSSSGALEKDRPLLNASLNHIGKAYPIASEKARKNFQKMHLQNSNYNHKLVMVQKNARVQNLEQDPFFKRNIGLDEEEKVRLQQLHRFFFFDKKKLHERIEENKRKSQSTPLNKTLPPSAVPQVDHRDLNQKSSQTFILPQDTRHEASRNLTMALNNFSTNGSGASFANQMLRSNLNKRSKFSLKNQRFLQNQQEGIDWNNPNELQSSKRVSPRSAPKMGKIEVLPSIENSFEKSFTKTSPRQENYHTLQNQGDKFKLRQSGRNPLLSKSAVGGPRDARSLSRNKTPKLVPRKDIPIVPSLPYYKKQDYKRELSAFVNFPLSFKNHTSRVGEARQSGEGVRSRFVKPLFSELLPSKSGKYSLGEKVKF